MKRAKDIDWRASLVSEFTEDTIINGKNIPSGNAVYRTTSVIQDGIQVNFPDPSPTALFLSLAHKSHQKMTSLYDQVVQHYLNDDYSDLYEYFEYAMASVVFSFNALEAYANGKIVEDKYYERKLKSGIYGALSSSSIEWLSLDEKLGNVLPQQLNIETIKGKALWEKFVKLRKLRNKIIHLTKKDQARSNYFLEMYPQNIWAELFQVCKDNYPKTSKNIILHFENQDRLPHWLKYINV